MIDQVRQILKESEGITVEFKTSRNELNKNTFESICAFLNRKGGHLLLGVTDNGTVEGIEKAKVQSLVDRLVSSMNNPQKLSPMVYLIPEIVDLDGKKIIYLHIPESSKFIPRQGRYLTGTATVILISPGTTAWSNKCTCASQTVSQNPASINFCPRGIFAPT